MSNIFLDGLPSDLWGAKMSDAASPAMGIKETSFAKTDNEKKNAAHQSFFLVMK